MATITFDTRKAVRKLQANGFDSAQADALVDTLAEAFSESVATKADIADLKADMADFKAATQADVAAVRSDVADLKAATQADVADLKAATQADVANLKAEMFRALWIQGAALIGLQLTIAGLLFAALKWALQ